MKVEWPEEDGWPWPRLPVAFLALGAIVAVAVFTRDAYGPAAYIIGVLLGALYVWITDNEGPMRVRGDKGRTVGDVDPVTLGIWITNAHRYHGGTLPSYTGAGAFPIAACTEPSCQEGVRVLEALRLPSKRGRR